jgi:hypothetical protein
LKKHNFRFLKSFYPNNLFFIKKLRWYHFMIKLNGVDPTNLWSLPWIRSNPILCFIGTILHSYLSNIYFFFYHWCQNLIFYFYFYFYKIKGKWNGKGRMNKENLRFGSRQRKLIVLRVNQVEIIILKVNFGRNGKKWQVRGLNETLNGF